MERSVRGPQISSLHPTLCPCDLRPGGNLEASQAALPSVTGDPRTLPPRIRRLG